MPSRKKESSKAQDTVTKDYKEELRSDNGNINWEDIELQEEMSIPITRIPFPWLIRASGSYEWKMPLKPIPFPRKPPIPIRTFEELSEEEPTYELEEEALFPIWFKREQLRLDIDGKYPQMVASGTMYSGYASRVHWIANLKKQAANTYTGFIWYKDGNKSLLPHTYIRITVIKSLFTNQRKAKVIFIGRGVGKRVRTYNWKSGYFRSVNFEFDHVEDTTAITSVNTCDHPNRPQSIPCENLTIENVFRRSGFDVTTSPGGPVPLSGANTDAKWSDMEMHDAMQVYWSHFENKPKWSMWVLFASLHERGSGLGGIMFDDIGPNHRQGTAIFNDSFINVPPIGDSNPNAWVRRMKFWTAVHEMGHAFNLAHSWQKELGNPWIPLSNEPEERSFMNYPYGVSGGQQAFFGDFEYRFSDNELLFTRHAPERFVQMGNADWFDNHGFEQANTLSNRSLVLNLRVHRNLDYFEYLEPVAVELKLTNVSDQPKIVNEKILQETDEMTIIIKKRGKPARQWHPFAQYCFNGDKIVLSPGKSIYASVLLSSGLNGWDIAEPGIYQVQAALNFEEQDIISNTLQLKVAPPLNHEMELIAQDYFSEEVGRILTFKGSQVLDKANDLLREIIERFKDHRASLHAQLTINNPLILDYKLLNISEKDSEVPKNEKKVELIEAEPEVARETLSKTLVNNASEAVDTLGHIPYKQTVEHYSKLLADKGDPETAASCLEKASKTLKDRDVLDSVVKKLEQQASEFSKQKKTSKSKS